MNEKALGKELELWGIKDRPHLEIVNGIVEVLYEPLESKKVKALDMVEIFRGVDSLVSNRVSAEMYKNKYSENERMILVLDTVRWLDGRIIKREEFKYRLRNSFRRRIV